MFSQYHVNKHGNLANPNCVAYHLCRVELCTDDGTTLKAFSLDECQGAPHEFRGVKRSTLLEALQSSVPESCIEYNAAIHSVETDQNGKTRRSAAAICFLSACVDAHNTDAGMAPCLTHLHSLAVCCYLHQQLPKCLLEYMLDTY